MAAKKLSKQKIETVLAQDDYEFHDTIPDHTPPIHLTSTYRFKNADQGADLFAGRESGHIYGRMSNENTCDLAKKIAKLENTEDGIVTSSGMSAFACIIMGLMKAGDNCVASSMIYGGTYKLLNVHAARYGLESRILSMRDARSLKKIEEAIDSKTRFLFMETPANPTLDIFNIASWARIAKKHGIALVVDNTFATPYLQRPIDWGAHIVFHSSTKDLNGHGDSVGGIVVGPKFYMDMLRDNYFKDFGPCQTGLDAWLIARGLKTLHLRMDYKSDSSMQIAEWLQKHPKVKKVYYPGLKNHRCHKTAAKQMKKFGGVMAFDVKGGVAAGKKIMDSVEVATLAVSLGNCDTLIQHPASMTHSAYSAADRKKAGLTDGLIRLSVGIEHPDDIIGDLKQALKKA